MLIKNSTKTIKAVYIVVVSTFAVILLSYFIYEDSKKLWTYTYSVDEIIDTILEEGTNSEVITLKNKEYLLLRQEVTPLTLNIAEAFEEITVRVYYYAPRAEQLNLRTLRNPVPDDLKGEQTFLFEKLNDENWRWIRKEIELSADVVVYEKPGLPPNYPPLTQFLQESTIDQIMDRGLNFVVHNDQNTTFKGLGEPYELTNIAYLVVPKPVADPTQVEAPQLEVLEYIIDITEEPLILSEPEGNTIYAIDIAFLNYQEGDWATISKLEVIGSRGPVVITPMFEWGQSLLNRLTTGKF